MSGTILVKLQTTCPFPEAFEQTELLDDSSTPVPIHKIGHIRADYDSYRWWNTVWPCRRKLATLEICKEIDEVYDTLTAKDALRDLDALRKFCAAHMEACVSKEYQVEFSFFYEGKACDFWIRLITRKGDYNLYLNAFAKVRRKG